MTKTLSIAILSILFVVTGALQTQAGETKNLVTILTSPNAQTQLMSMILTTKVAKSGMDSYILLCGPAADIALKDAPKSATTPQPPKDMSPQGLMKMLMEKTGATVEVCAIYLPSKDADASILIDGVGVAKPGKMGDRLTAPNTQVISF